MSDNETVRALIAGWFSGVGVAFITMALLLIVLVRDPKWRARVARSNLKLPLVGVIALNALMLFWTLVGLVFGALYLGLGQPTFSITVSIITLIATGGCFFVRGVLDWTTHIVLLTPLILFGGLLPALAAL